MEQEGAAVPKVIDFGIAKATGQWAVEMTLLTQFGQMVGTPEYASPEQAEVTTADVDESSDVYSLGLSCIKEPRSMNQPPDDPDSGRQEFILKDSSSIPPDYGHFVPGLNFCVTAARSRTSTMPSRFTSARASKPVCPVFLPNEAFTMLTSVQLI